MTVVRWQMFAVQKQKILRVKIAPLIQLHIIAQSVARRVKPCALDIKMRMDVKVPMSVK
jgi:hypothetical protein